MSLMYPEVLTDAHIDCTLCVSAGFLWQLNQSLSQLHLNHLNQLKITEVQHNNLLLNVFFMRYFEPNLK